MKLFDLMMQIANAREDIERCEDILLMAEQQNTVNAAKKLIYDQLRETADKLHTIIVELDQEGKQC